MSKEELQAGDFAIDYAKLGTSKCKNTRCLAGKENMKITKGSLRMNKVSVNAFHNGEGVVNSYFHPECIFEQFKRAKAATKVLEDLNDLKGLDKLSIPDRQTIITLFNKYQTLKNGDKTKTVPVVNSKRKQSIDSDTENVKQGTEDNIDEEQIPLEIKTKKSKVK
jgi:hypothetical protein